MISTPTLGPDRGAGLRRRVTKCRRCPRLIAYAKKVAAERPPRFAESTFWGKPVSGFGDLDGRLLVIGLAPARTGGLRTGRIFTGDASSSFLVNALHEAGFANQPSSDSIDDGLVYRDCYITAAVKCAPPGDKPNPDEFANCAPFMDEEIALMGNLQSVLALGAFAFRAYSGHLTRRGVSVHGLKFAHGKVYRFPGVPSLYASYHPSPRNTNTGKLTSAMLAAVLSRIKHEFAK